MIEFFKNYLEREKYDIYNERIISFNFFCYLEEDINYLIEKFSLKEVGRASILNCNESCVYATIGKTKNKQEVLFLFYVSEYPYEEYSISYILEGEKNTTLAENNSAKEELSSEEYKREEKYLSPKNPLTTDMVDKLWEKL